MERRQFLRGLGLASAAPLISACANTLRVPVDVTPAPSDAHNSRDSDGIWREGAAYARWSPSPHNVQPWLLRVVSPTHCELLYDPSRLLPNTDPTSAFTIIGLTIFTEYLAVAVAERGYGVRAEYVARAIDYSATSPTLFANLELVPLAERPAFNRQLILQRKTSRLPYDYTAVDQGILQQVSRVVNVHDHSFTWSSDDDMVHWMLDLNRIALMRDLDEKVGRTELRKWIRTTDEQAFAKKDGLWSHCLRYPGWLLKAVFEDDTRWRSGWRASLCGKMMLRGMQGTKTVAWWQGPFAEPDHWIAAGKVLAQSWLALAANDIQMHPFGSVITNPHAHQLLRDKVGVNEGKDTLWLLARLGRSHAPPRSYRLDAASIFMDDNPQGS